MKIHRFFVEQTLPESGQVKISDIDLVHQLRHVLRFQVGHQLILLDNSGDEFHCHIVSTGSREVLLEIDSCKHSGGSKYENNIRRQISGSISMTKISLFMALSKRDSFEWILEKGTELGVSEFVPIQSERSEKKDLNIARSKKIVREASEQSERTILPEIKEVVSLEGFLGGISISKNVSEPQQFFVLDPRGTKLNQKTFGDLLSADSVGVFIGPEGGWSEKEMELFKSHSIRMYSLGKNILRAETAAIACISLFALSPKV